MNKNYGNNRMRMQQPTVQAVVYRSSPLQGQPACPDGAALAMTYVPWQRWNTTLDCEAALCRGTIFPELDLPFTCRRCGA